MAGQSRSGDCFFISDDESAAGVGVQYAQGHERNVQRERGAGRRRPELGLDLVGRPNTTEVSLELLVGAAPANTREQHRPSGLAEGPTPCPS